MQIILLIVVVVVVADNWRHSVLGVWPWHGMHIGELQRHLIDQMDFNVVLQFPDDVPDLGSKMSRGRERERN